MSNKMALDALTAALDAMEHMANTLNNMDAVDEDEDAQHDAAFEAVRVAIAELKKPQKSRIVAAPMASYPEADQRFFNFWYGHMFEDLMQPPLVGIDHATARYIWNAAAIAALQAAPQGWRPIETAPKDGSTYLVADATCAMRASSGATTQAVRMLTDAARDVLAERQRQISAEGWTPEHDDEHDAWSMAVAAACYSLWDRPATQATTGRLSNLWQWTGWDQSWFKPKDPRRNLVRAAALLLAEIERLDRAGRTIPPSGEIGGA